MDQQSHSCRSKLRGLKTMRALARGLIAINPFERPPLFCLGFGTILRAYLLKTPLSRPCCLPLTARSALASGLLDSADRMPQVSSADLAALAAEDQGTALWTIVTTFSVLAQVAVVGRLCARRLKGASLAADDYLICLALVTSLTAARGGQDGLD